MTHTDRGPVVRSHEIHGQGRNPQAALPGDWPALITWLGQGNIHFSDIAKCIGDIARKVESNSARPPSNSEVRQLLDNLPSLGSYVTVAALLNWSRLLKVMGNLTLETKTRVKNKTVEMIGLVSRPLNWTELRKFLMNAANLIPSMRSGILQAIDPKIIPSDMDGWAKGVGYDVMQQFGEIDILGSIGRAILNAVSANLPEKDDDHTFAMSLYGLRECKDWPEERIVLYEQVFALQKESGPPAAKAIASFIGSLQGTAQLPERIDALLSEYIEWVMKNPPSFSVPQIGMMLHGFRSNRDWSQGRNDCCKMLTPYVKNGPPISDQSVSSYLSTFSAVTSLPHEGKELLEAILPLVEAAALDSAKSVVSSLLAVAQMPSGDTAEAVLGAIRKAMQRNADATLEDNLGRATIGGRDGRDETDLEHQQLFLALCLHALKNHWDLAEARMIVRLAYQRGCHAIEKDLQLSTELQDRIDNDELDLCIHTLLLSRHRIEQTPYGLEPLFDVHGFDYGLAEYAVRQYLKGVPGEEGAVGFLAQQDVPVCKIVTGITDSMKEIVRNVCDELKGKPEYIHLGLELIDKFGSIVIRKGPMLPQQIRRGEGRY